MNAVEIEEAVSALVEAPFDAAEFPYAFLAAFGNKATTIKRLRSGTTNKSDIPGGLLQRNNIHLAVCPPGEVGDTIKALVASPATAAQKAKYALATDGQTIEAENRVEGETLACDYVELANHFGFFLPLAGITTVKEIRENAFDIKATGRLNKLYIELLQENPDWDTSARREDLNHFFARLIFCFFAEDTNIFHNPDLFTATIEQMTASDSSNTHEVLSEIFRAMNTKIADRNRGPSPSQKPSPAATASDPPKGRVIKTPSPREGRAPSPGEGKLRPWADAFPYVNGGLFSGSPDVPRFSKIARSYLIHIGHLDWQQINPDIFGSMIQAVADDEERGALGMHYTSVPNILKVLNPLFLDDLREKLAEAGDNKRKLLNLRNRLAKIRVFDPACGSGNFLVIAYKEMRKIEAEINRRRGEEYLRSEIPLTNFRGIELRHFSAEIARLALIIAEYQCDVLYRGERLALAEFLPLEADNWITCGNALRLDWLKICPPTGKGVKVRSDDLFETPLDQAEIDFENEGGETYICGNPPYLGSSWQSKEQKSELEAVFAGRVKTWKSLDYVSGWFMKAADFGRHTASAAAFVSTNSICQGQQVPILWPLIFATDAKIMFAHTSFKWSNLASDNAGVTVVIIGFSRQSNSTKRLYSSGENGEVTAKTIVSINPYLVPGAFVEVNKAASPLSAVSPLDRGSSPVDGGNLLLDTTELEGLTISVAQRNRFVREVVGSAELIRGLRRFCLWIEDGERQDAEETPAFRRRIKAVREMRIASRKAATRKGAEHPHRFDEKRQKGDEEIIAVPRISSVSREFLPVGLLRRGTIITDLNFGMYNAPTWNLSLIASRTHLVWIATVCGKLKTDYRYSNTLGWNTFPVPPLSDQNKADLTRCAEDILLAREAHFPATIADLYDPDAMPANLRAAHDRNDETLERIYIGRRFKNDTERLEKLFEMYTEMTAGDGKGK